MQNKPGPKTEQGKARVSQNALKHGITAKKLFLLQNENPEQWNELLADCVQQFQPTTPFEHRLVTEIAFAWWRMQRAWVTETAIMDTEMDDQFEKFSKTYRNTDEGVRQGCAFRAIADNSKSLPLVIRYESRLERAYKRAIKTLEDLRARENGPAAEAHVPS